MSTPALTAVVAGQSYDLNDGQEIRLLDYDLGMAEIRRLSQRAAAQIGDTDVGYRWEPRYLDLVWGIVGSSLSDYRDIRERLQTVFLPRTYATQLIFAFGDRTRALDVHLDGELLWSDRVEVAERVSGIFKASDPRLYDPAVHAVTFSFDSISGGGDGMPVPLAIPWEVGADVLDLVIDVTYAGASKMAAPEYPVIRIAGPIEDPVITNETTGEVIDLSGEGGLVLSDSSEWVDVDLASPPGDAKTITDQDGNSAEQYLTTDSDLATFHLAPAGELLSSGIYATGVNSIRVTGDNVTQLTVVTLRYYDRYYGV